MGDYTVGYGKPPQATRFQKGKSGNPRGRLKGERNLKTDLEEELRGTITVTEGGRKSKVSKQRALIKALLARGLGGDIRSATVLLNLMLKVIDPEAQPPGTASMPAEDIKILERFLARHTATEPSHD